MLFSACSDVYNLMEEDEEEEDGTVTSGAQTPVTPKILMHPADDFPTGHTSTQSDENITQNYDRTSTSTIVEESEDLQSSTDTPTSGNS